METNLFGRFVSKCWEEVHGELELQLKTTLPSILQLSNVEGSLTFTYRGGYKNGQTATVAVTGKQLGSNYIILQSNSNNLRFSMKSDFSLCFMCSFSSFEPFDIGEGFLMSYNKPV